MKTLTNEHNSLESSWRDLQDFHNSLVLMHRSNFCTVFVIFWGGNMIVIFSHFGCEVYLVGTIRNIDSSVGHKQKEKGEVAAGLGPRR